MPPKTKPAPKPPQHRNRKQHRITLLPAEWGWLEQIRVRRGLRSISSTIAEMAAEELHRGGR